MTDGVAASVENDASKMPSLGSPRPLQANGAQIVQDLKKTLRRLSDGRVQRKVLWLSLSPN